MTNINHVNQVSRVNRAIPEEFISRYAGIVDDSEKFLASLDKYPPKAFRVNTIKAEREEIIAKFSEYNIGISPVSFYSDAFTTNNLEIGSTLEHFLGKIYIQELPSMLPPLLVRKELENENIRLVVDGCAAPGSKTTQCAALMQNRGLLIANDIDYTRTKALKFNTEKCGTFNTVIVNRDFRHLPNFGADVVILDAPCSAEGTARKNYEVFLRWSSKKIAGHATLQKQLILKGYDMLRSGGVMIYSTCTFAPEENEGVVSHLIEKRSDAVIEQIEEDAQLSPFKFGPAIMKWQEEAFPKAVSACRRVWPHHNDTGGFFLCKVRKK